MNSNGLNHFFRIVWNASKGAWQAVSEIAKGQGKSKSSKTARPAVAAGSFVLLSFATLLALGQAQAADVLPSGGTVTAGSASISTTAGAMIINQTTARMAADWQSFSIGQGNSVTFNQPSAASVALNRVLGADVSVIQGALKANGQVFLLNPNGVLFTPTAQVNVGAMVASTLNMKTENFMAGNYKFDSSLSMPVKGSAIINQGNITATGDAGTGGSIALIAARIINTGTLTANQGNVLLGAGSTVTLDLGGPVKLQVEQRTLDALIENKGAIFASGGVVLLTARAAGDLAASAINHSGLIEASSITTQGGRIVLDAGPGGTTQVTGSINATSATNTGGSITALGKNVGLFEQAQLNASGATGGGTVLVGGGWQGKDTSLHNAQAVVLSKGASIDVSATQNGSGGTAVLWSEAYTGFFGHIDARGGAQGGDGGRVETSSHKNLQALGRVSIGAPLGKPGDWLLDPYDVTITNDPLAVTNGVALTDTGFVAISDNAIISTASIQEALNAGGNVTVSTGATGTQVGTITVTGTLAATGTNDASLTLAAAGDIVVTANASITGSSGALNTTLSAGSGGTTGNITVANGAVIDTHGGSATLSGSATGTVSLTGATITTGATEEKKKDATGTTATTTTVATSPAAATTATKTATTTTTAATTSPTTGVSASNTTSALAITSPPATTTVAPVATTTTVATSPAAATTATKTATTTAATTSPTTSVSTSNTAVDPATTAQPATTTIATGTTTITAAPATTAPAATVSTSTPNTAVAPATTAQPATTTVATGTTAITAAPATTAPAATVSTSKPNTAAAPTTTAQLATTTVATGTTATSAAPATTAPAAAAPAATAAVAAAVKAAGAVNVNAGNIVMSSTASISASGVQAGAINIGSASTKTVSIAGSISAVGLPVPVIAPVVAPVAAPIVVAAPVYVPESVSVAPVYVAPVAVAVAPAPVVVAAPVVAAPVIAPSAPSSTTTTTAAAPTTTVSTANTTPVSQGGAIVIRGQSINLASTSKLDASGDTAGGNVSVGAAETTSVVAAGTIDVSAKAAVSATPVATTTVAASAGNTGATGSFDTQGSGTPLAPTASQATPKAAHGGTVTLLATAATAPGAAPSQVTVSGKVSADSASGQGGKIVATGTQVTLESTAKLSATGAQGGGSVLVGGSYQNSDPSVYQATGTSVAKGAQIDVSATKVGNGGTAVVWSDIHNANAVTRFDGNIAAKGGAEGGNGGRVETSGATLIVGDNARVNTLAQSAAQGDAGTWLLDPTNFTIAAGSGGQTTSSIGATTLQTNLGIGNVSIATSGTVTGAELGDIAVNAALDWSANKLTLSAHNNITVVAALNGSGTSSLELNANTNNNATPGKITLNADITTGGAQAYNGAVVLGGNRNLTTTDSDISFSSTVNATSSGAQSLTLNQGSGSALFYGTVGGTALSSLNVAGTGTTTVGFGLTGGVTTTGAQTYNGDLRVGATSTTLASTSGGVTVMGAISSYRGAYDKVDFTSTGTWSAPTNIVAGTVQVLVVGGGGAGGSAYGNTVSGTIQYASVSGGGGAGGVVYYSGLSLTAGASYAVTVGAGGVGKATSAPTEAGWSGFAPSSGSAFNFTAGGGARGSGIYNNSGVYTVTSSLSNCGGSTCTAMGYGGGGGNYTNNGYSTSNNLSIGAAVAPQYNGGSYSGSANVATAASNRYNGGSGAGAGSSASATAGGQGRTFTMNSHPGVQYHVSGGGAGGAESTMKLGAGTVEYPGIQTGGNGGLNNASGSDGVTYGSGGGGAVNNTSSNGVSIAGGSGKSGVVVIGYGQNGFTGAGLTVNAGSGKVDLRGAIGGNGLASVAVTSTATDNVISGAIGGTTTLGYTGTAVGALALSGTNTHTGATTVTSGTLKIGAGGTVGSGTITVGSNGSSTASLDLNGNAITNVLALNGYGVGGSSGAIGALTNSSATAATASGAVTLNSTTYIGGSGSGNTTISGAIGGAFGLTKVGTSTLTLSGANTYTGSFTTVNAGTLAVTGTGTLGDITKTLELNNAGVFDLQNKALTVGALVMNGTSSITNSSGTGSLSVTGTSTLANSVTTSGTQTYTGAVTLAAATALNSTNSDVTFGSTVNGAQGLTINQGTGKANFNGIVGATANLASLNVAGTGATYLGSSATEIKTSGAQSYAGNLYLGAATTSLTSTSNGAITVTGDVFSNLWITSSQVFNTTNATTTGTVSWTAPTNMVGNATLLVVGGGGAGGYGGTNVLSYGVTQQSEI